MNIGTKTLLFGNHQFALHPLFVLLAWIKLYGMPDWRELVCIIIHDWGYWGSPNLDGREGEDHAIRSGNLVVNRFFTKKGELFYTWAYYYRDLIWYHSRFISRRHNHRPSKLCLADKYGVALMPSWLWVFLGKLTGEITEYQSNKKYEIYQEGRENAFDWFRAYKRICQRWVEARDPTITWSEAEKGA